MGNAKGERPGGRVLELFGDVDSDPLTYLVSVVSEPAAVCLVVGDSELWFSPEQALQLSDWLAEESARAADLALPDEPDEPA